MKKLLIVMLVLLLALSLAACGAKEKAAEKAAEKILENAGVDANIDGDKVVVKGEDGEELTIGEGEWPSSDLAKSIPEFKGGKIVSVMEADDLLFIMIEEISEEDFTAYLEKTKEVFTEETVETNIGSGLMYAATNSEGLGVTLTYEKDAGFSIAVAQAADISESSPETPPEAPSEAPSEAPPETPPEVPSEMPDTSVLGTWMLGMVSMGELNADTGKYEDAYGMGQIYTFKPDGSYTALVIFGDIIWFTGNYSLAGDVLTLTDRTAEESTDGGKTWSAPETLPDASSHFVSGADETGTYLLLGEEGAAPPLVDKENSMKYQQIDLETE